MRVRRQTDRRVYARWMLITEVQSEQIRILHAHGQLTTPRLLQILDQDTDALLWMRDSWESSRTEEDNIEVRRVAAEAIAFLVSSRRSDPEV